MLVLVSLCSLGRALAQEEFDAKPIVLTEETFDANVSEGFWLLEFYAVSEGDAMCLTLI